MTKEEFKNLQIGDLVKRIETEPQYIEPVRLGVVTRMFNNASRTINIAKILWSYKGDTYSIQYNDGNLALARIELVSAAKRNND
jgi:hypothetical protein